ncbi:MAG: adenosylcobinamide-phosphate synthase CbiB [Nitrospirota bacterium]
MTEATLLALAYLLDLIIGDPRRIPHPVRLIGWAIEKTEHFLRNTFTVFDNGDEKTENKETGETEKIDITLLVPPFLRKGKELPVKVQERLAGGLLTVIIVGATYILMNLLQVLFFSFQDIRAVPYITFALLVFLTSTTLATRDLLKSGKAVIDEIKNGNLENSRIKLSMIVGRDTGAMKERGVLRGAIETLSENTSDGIVAPLFYFMIGGLPLAMTYKAINTLDSMVGYKNKKYKNFGWASARLDDITNYIPARITALMIVAASYVINALRFIVFRSLAKYEKVQNILGRFFISMLKKLSLSMESPDFEGSYNAFRIMKRDAGKHSSPNSGFPEAAMAGVLGVRLGGPAMYGGKKVHKSYMGEEKEDSLSYYIKASEDALLLTKLTSFLGLLFVLIII